MLPGDSVADLLVGEGVGAVPPLVARKARLLSGFQPTKERRRGAVEPRQHLAQDVAVDGGVRWNLRAHRGC